jgi:Sulfotransferase family
MIVYGEDYRLIERYPELLKGCMQHFTEKCRRTSYAREQVMKGIYDFDASMLYPDYEGYVQVISTGLLQLYRYYAKKSLEYGFKGWGIKHNIRSAEGFISFVEFFPKTRYIFITRNIVDVAKSEKARFAREYRGPADYAALAALWSRNVRLMRNLHGERFLKLEYHDVVDRPAEAIEKISQFCELEKIDPRVFQRKVNVSPVLDNLSEAEWRTEYRPPQPLAPAEAAAILKSAGALLTELGYARLNSVREVLDLASR